MTYGKWIGAFLGFLEGGPLGALAGLALGAMIDFMTDDKGSKRTAADSAMSVEDEGNRNGFLFSLMVLTAHIIHADGRIMHSEMEYVRRFLRTNFSAQAEAEGEQILLRLFQQKKQMGNAQWNTQMEGVCRQIGNAMTMEQRLQLVAFLCEIAKADGTVAPEERTELERVCQSMGLPTGTADQMLGLGGETLDDAYRVLGVSPDATDDEVRRAYKLMALQNHPDRVASLGDDIRQAAEKKFQEIADAKDRIYKARGMK